MPQTGGSPSTAGGWDTVCSPRDVTPWGWQGKCSEGNEPGQTGKLNHQQSPASSCIQLGRGGGTKGRVLLRAPTRTRGERLHCSWQGLHTKWTADKMHVRYIPGRLPLFKSTLISFLFKWVINTAVIPLQWAVSQNKAEQWGGKTLKSLYTVTIIL